MVDDTVLRKVLAVIRAHLDHLAAAGFDEGELSQVKWQRAMSFQLSGSTTVDLARDTTESLVRGFGTDLVTRLPALHSAVTKAELGGALATCRATSVFSLVGDRTRINSALAP